MTRYILRVLADNLETPATENPALSNFGISAKPIESDRSAFIMLDNREWTDHEVLKLLEAIEKYKDDWNKVCSLPRWAIHKPPFPFLTIE